MKKKIIAILIAIILIIIILVTTIKITNTKEAKSDLTTIRLAEVTPIFDTFHIYRSI